jgi:hypothetical protein
VGTDRAVPEARSIASALLGSADIVAAPAGLVEDFTQVMTEAMGKTVGDVALRLRTPVGTRTVSVRQVSPTVVDLTGRRVDAGPRTVDYPTGSWGDESRDYHVRLRVPAADIGQEMLAARVSLAVHKGDRSAHAAAQGLIRACGPATPRPSPPSTRWSPTTRDRRSSPRPSSRARRPQGR